MAIVTEADGPQESASPRVWPAVAIVAGMWATPKVTALLIPDTKFQILSSFYAPMVCAGLFVLWWIFASRVPWRQRLIGFALVTGILVATGLIADRSMAFALLMFTFPWVMTATVVLLLLKFIPWPSRRWLPIVATAGLCGFAMMLRLDGLTGNFTADLPWRWEPTKEELFAQSEDANEKPADQSLAISAELSPNDWPEFRGPARDGRISGVIFSTDWKATPPREVWRRQVGPGWGAFTVIGNTLFTQEQRGENEAVVAYAAETGKVLWLNEVESRFEETIGGPGPRATPTYHEGKLYTQGAGGKLQCIDATTGESIWVRDLLKDTPAKDPPMWGFSASPLIVGDLVYTYAGAGKGKSIVAYQRADGAVAWMGGKGTHSYSSPQLATFDGVPQVLMLSNYGLISFAPEDGKQLWEHEWDMGTDYNRVLQPLVLDNDVLIGTFMGMGTRRITVKHEADQWTTEEQWTSRSMKPYFNDFVEHDGYLYGFDNEIFACIDLKNGKKKWKRGRYGHGQVLLVQDMGMLLILGEQGELVLLEANPKKHKEVTKIQAIEGKTWNHPVIAGNLLFVRNGQEAACFELNPDVPTEVASR